MKKFSLLLVCVVALSMVGCKALCPAAESIVIHDTVRIEKEVYLKDTTLKTTPAFVRGVIALDSLLFTNKFKPVLKSHKNAKLTASVVGKSLVMGCYCDTVAIKAQLRETVIREYRSKQSEIKKPPVIIKETPKWKQYLAIFGGLSILYLLYKAFRFIITKIYPFLNFIK